jgi:hypothetical protein
VIGFSGRDPANSAGAGSRKRLTGRRELLPSRAAYYGRDLNGKTTRDLSAVVGNLVRREYRQAYIAQRPVLVERRRRVRGVSIMIAKLILPLSSDGRAIDLLLAGSYPHP